MESWRAARGREPVQVMESGHPGAAWEEGAGQGPRAKQDSELRGQRWSRWDI